jgi:cell division protein FtsQ
MLKKILEYSVLVLAVCYIVAALFIIPGKDEEELCCGVTVKINENSDILSSTDVMSMLNEMKLDPKGKRLKEVKCFEIERYMNSISLIRNCQTYKTNKGDIVLEIDCRRPILAVIDRNDRQYCIDADGAIIDGIPRQLHLPLATGNIVDSMATCELKEVANAIGNDEFWKAQTEQVHFDTKRNIILVPRVGDHIIELGTADSISTKLSRVKSLYMNGLSTVGWNKYIKLNAEYSDRVICTKRE